MDKDQGLMAQPLDLMAKGQDSVDHHHHGISIKQDSLWVETTLIMNMIWNRLQMMAKNFPMRAVTLIKTHHLYLGEIIHL